MTATYKITTKNVNSKTLYNSIISDIDHIIRAFSNEMAADCTARAIIMELTEESLLAHAEINKLAQWNVICDKRNNKRETLALGTTYIDITYVQTHCLNTTSIRYTIES